jgi:CHRD domain
MLKLFLQSLVTIWTLWFFLASYSWAQIEFTAEITGTQEVPPNVGIAGRGVGSFILTGQELTFKVTVDGLTGPIADAHFHNAPAGMDGGIVRTIRGDFVGNTASGTWKSNDPEPLTQALINELLAGRLYINIHTAMFPGGEIRGQIGPATLVSAVLPSSRSVQVGAAATAFATIINAGSTTAIGCGISVLTGIAANFSYQATDPANQPVGNPNTPVNIVPGGAQNFIISLTPTAAIAPTDVQFSFDCGNTNPAPINVGLNTLLFSASITPVPDIVALAAAIGGIVDISGATGAGAFAVATVNVGAMGTITASADTGNTALPMIINLCETNPITAQCISAVGPSVNTQINANATPTFGIFVAGTGNVPFDPAANRIFVRFKDGSGVTRGSTSVAVRTQ